MCTSRKADIIYDIATIIEKMSTAEIDGELTSATLEDLGIGTGPIGQGEFLELQHRIEQKFNIRLSTDEIPEPEKAKHLTLGQIVDLIEKKINI